MISRIPSPLVNILKLAAIVAAILGALYLLLLVFKYAAPFVIALLLAALIEPLNRFLSQNRKFPIPRSLAALIGTILIVSIVAFGLFGVGNLLFTQARELITTLPEHYPHLEREIRAYIIRLERNMDILPAKALQAIDNILSQLEAFLSGFVSKAARYLYHYAVSIPEIMLFIILTVLGIYFISRDWLKIQESINEQLPRAWLDRFRIFRRDMLAALFGLIRATLVLMAITFIQLYLGLRILQVQYALLMAFIITIFDALPVIGAGLFLVPWAIYAFITGNIKLGIGLLIIQVSVSVVRQVVQPKVLGDQIGIHPLATMITMYAGFKFFGLSGLIFGPIVFVIVKSILGYYTRGRSFKQLVFGDGS
ncbi:MAG: sporulation integral membrane protein YtvI [Dethiobacteria bacterium]